MNSPMTLNADSPSLENALSARSRRGASWRHVLHEQGRPLAVSILFHLTLLLFFIWFAVTASTPRSIRRAVVEVDTENAPRVDLFEAVGPVIVDDPPLRPPGGGPLREAVDPVAGDPGPIAPATTGEVSGLDHPTQRDVGQAVSPGGTGTGSGLGLIEGLGGAGGGGVGTTQFFGASAKGKRFLYVIDRSASMAEHGAMDVAKREILASIGKLSPSMYFQIILYNDEPSVLNLGVSGLALASERNIAKARELVQSASPLGGTDHEKALRRALELKPDVVFFLSDADDANGKMIAQISNLNNRSRKSSCTIHVIQFVHDPFRKPDKTIRQLAERNRGTYRMIDTRSLAQAP